MTSPSSQDVTVLTQAILENAQRLGLKWSLIPGTVTQINTGSAQVMVLIDGDSVDIGAHSLIGTFDINTRVMVLVIPGANYVIGLYGDVNIRRSLIQSNNLTATSGATLNTTPTILPGCSMTLVLTRPALIRLEQTIDVQCNTTGANTAFATAYLDGVALKSAVTVLRTFGDRYTPHQSDSFELAAGTYAIDMRVNVNAVSGSHAANLGGTLMIVDVYQ